MHRQNSKKLLYHWHRHTRTPEYYRERTRKDRQVPRFTNKIGETVEIKAEVVPVVDGALGTISHNLKFYLKKIDIAIVTSCLQKTAFLGTFKLINHVVIPKNYQNSFYIFLIIISI